MSAPDLRAHALAAHAAGLCVLPPKEDGSKQPDAISWTRYQETRSTREEIAAWYAAGRRTGLGLVCGAVSGHLELFEFDDLETHARFLAAAADAGLGPLAARVAEGYSEQTPGSGLHWLYLVQGGGAKTVALARRPGVDAAGKPHAFPLIETKGEGGYVVVAPSHGGVHPSGKAYHLLSGGFATIATISETERDALWSLARSFDEVETPPAREWQPKPDDRWLVRPGDDFNERAEWADILEPHGWEPVRRQREATLWRRPGGHPGGWGASTDHGGRGLLHVFTTAAPPLTPDRSCTKFTAHALLAHGGDFAAAARDLAARGYGERRPPPGPGEPSAPPHPAAVPPFPLAALPPVARTFVADGAAALGCPPDFVAVPLLAFVGAVAGNSRRLRLKPGFEVGPIFWTGVVGKPGTVKTPALNLSRRLLDVLQGETWTAYRTWYERWLEGKPAERGPKPLPEHFFATDTTTEAVAHALQTSRGIAIIHDELAGWVLAFDAYKKGGDRQSWLSSWSAAPLKPNRKTAEPIYIPDPVVCVVGGVQPDVLPALAGEAARDDGFIPRLLLVWPDAEPSPWTAAVLAEPVFAAMLAVVRPLRLGGEDVATTRLSAGAYREWVAWYDETRLLTGAATGLTAGWGAKAPVHLARIALVLHLLAHPADRARALSAGTMRDAILLVEYFRAHLARVLPAFGAAAPTSGARLGPRILRMLAAAFPDRIGRAELAIRLGGHEAGAAVDAALAELESRGQAERRTAATAGRPREEWRWVADPVQADAEDDDGEERETGPDGPAVPRAHAPAPRDGGEAGRAGADREPPARDKWKDVESPPRADFPRNHVTTQPVSPGATGDPEPDAAWERWEEPL